MANVNVCPDCALKLEREVCSVNCHGDGRHYDEAGVFVPAIHEASAHIEVTFGGG